MFNHKTALSLNAEQIACAAKALKWAAFGGYRQGPALKYKQSAPDRLRFETEYQGRKAWVELDIPYTPLSLLVAGALILQQLHIQG